MLGAVMRAVLANAISLLTAFSCMAGVAQSQANDNPASGSVPRGSPHSTIIVCAEPSSMAPSDIRDFSEKVFPGQYQVLSAEEAIKKKFRGPATQIYVGIAFSREAVRCLSANSALQGLVERIISNYKATDGLSPPLVGGIRGKQLCGQAFSKPVNGHFEAFAGLSFSDVSCAEANALNIFGLPGDYCRHTNICMFEHKH